MVAAELPELDPAPRTPHPGEASAVAAQAEARRLAAELLPRSDMVAEEVLRAVLAGVPQLVATGSPDAVAVTRQSTEQNIGAMLATIAFGVAPNQTEPPAATRELLRATVAAGGDVTVLFSAYRVGHRRLWECWSDHVATSISDPELERQVLHQTSDHFFTFIDHSCLCLLEQYRADFSADPALIAVSDDASAAKRQLIDALVSANAVDLDHARIALGYELGNHHLSLVLIPVTSRVDLHRVLSDVRTLLGPAQVLTRLNADGTWWVWLGYRTRPTAEDLERLSSMVLDDAIVALGDSDFGLRGFRRSHEQALETERTVRLARTLRPGVVRHEEIALAALLCTDQVRAEEFSAQRLGPMAQEGEAMARLRTTVRVYLSCGRSKLRASERLHVHQKTVTYRLSRAEELLGRSIAEDAAELDAALRIHFTLFGV